MKLKLSQGNGRHEIDMLHGSLLDKILLFAIPLALTSTLQQLFNSADIAVVGQFDTSQALAAVGSNGPSINLLVNLFVGLSLGANVTVATLIGQGRQDKINDAIHTIMAIALVCGLFLFCWGVAMPEILVKLINTPHDVVDLATLYLRIYFMGAPCIMLYNFGSAILRAKGDSKRPLYALITGGIINVILNLIFVIVFKLSVAGVALATAIANGISAAIVLRCLMREDIPFKLEWRKIFAKFKMEHVKHVLRIGLPAGIQGSLFSISNIVIYAATNSFGSLASAGCAAALNYDFIIYHAISAFVQAGVTFTSQNFGAGNEQRCKRVYILVMAASLTVSGLACAACGYWRIPLLKVYTRDPDALVYGEIRMLRAVGFLWLVNTYEIAGGAMRAMGHSLIPTILVLLGCCVFRIFWVYAIFPHWGTFTSLINVYPTSWVITGIPALIVFWHVRKKCFQKPLY